ncbi:MAG TPA: arginine:agmatine antiporter, partial [Alphaproteobacteria bacterium]|nr:arginine:agmatine antiporter [Alphaproteobacteria bacterium]
LLGWFWFHPSTYMGGWNVTGKSDLTAIGMTLNFTLWAFIGVESASVSTAVVKNPTRNVPIATVTGVIIAAVCYILSSSVIMGIIPNKELISSSAPFSQAVSIALGQTAGDVVAICAAIGCLGSLGGWTLLVGQTAQAAANDGLFGKMFACETKKGVPATGLAIVACIMTAQVLGTMSPTASEQFGKIASIAVIMTLLPYIYSAVAIKIIGREKMSAKQGIFYTVIGLIAAFYSMAAMVGSDPAQTRWALMFVIFTVILYELSENRQLEMEGKNEKITCVVPTYVRHLTLLVTIAALVLTFWISFKDEHDLKPHIKGHFPAVEHSDTLG